ncbi:MAG: hypothetical protein AB8B52_11970 [Winogradskyella sp.]|uniref:hypothetical protein n=1 Tax=Winogradskyella sp. TaxID=1883156 RepID=UPI00385EB3E8
MDKKILGNFIIYFPTLAYIAYHFVMKTDNSGIDWTSIVITVLIAMVSGAIGNRIKNKGEVE